MTMLAERTQAVTVTKLHPMIGAEIGGVDLRRPLDKDTLRQVMDAWHEHTVLLFRDQHLSEDDQRRFASYFGPVAKRVPPKPGAPGADTSPAWDDMMMITDKVDANGKALGSLGHGEMWFHTEKCYHRTPHRATFLYGIDIPSVGGHTQFASMYAAYENLPADLKRRLEGAWGHAGPAIRRRPAHRHHAAAGEHASLPAADLCHQSRLGQEGALYRQPELDVDRGHGSQRERGAAAEAVRHRRGPGDHLRARLYNAFIFSSIVTTLRAIKERRQVILVTHNANIAVFGDSELILPMHRENDCGKTKDLGSIDTGATKRRVLDTSRRWI